MFQVITARLACLARRVQDYRLARDLDVAAANGWQVRRVAPGTYQFRDPRFDRLRAVPVPRSPARTGGGRDG